MSDTTCAQPTLTLREFAQHEYMGPPLTEMVHVRVSKPMAVFLKATALTEGLTESTIVRFACQQWASSQGYSRSCV